MVAKHKRFAHANICVLSALVAFGAALPAGDVWAQAVQTPQVAQSAQASEQKEAAQNQQPPPKQAVQPQQAEQTSPNAQTQEVAENAQVAQPQEAAQAAQTAEALQSASLRPIASAPSYQQLVSGLLVRTRFVVEAGPNRRVEIWDLLIGPGMRSDATVLPGGAVIEVRGGSGQIVMDGRSQELRPGATLAIPDRTSFQFVNGRNDLGLAVRATLIIGRRP